MVTITCVRCGKEFQTWPSQVKLGRKFCSRQCRARWQATTKVKPGNPHYQAVRAEPQMPPDPVDLAQEIREAVARGWCHKATSHLEMNPDLAEAIVKEVVATIGRIGASGPRGKKKTGTGSP